ncbi:hypothetical protein GALL_268840 [mine drainage metagenome]|uniref:Uncharacterized protein n=1 Tax=mine drainage metagenome TaxID=410659 RepID=A0A1J5R5J7_9ZZZZ
MSNHALLAFDDLRRLKAWLGEMRRQGSRAGACREQAMMFAFPGGATTCAICGTRRWLQRACPAASASWAGRRFAGGRCRSWLTPCCSACCARRGRPGRPVSSAWLSVSVCTWPVTAGYWRRCTVSRDWRWCQRLSPPRYSSAIWRYSRRCPARSGARWSRAATASWRRALPSRR